MPCGKAWPTTSPNSPAKAISHIGFVWGTFFLDPELAGIARGQRCVAHLAQSALGTAYALRLLLFDAPFPSLS
jgi:hypothetical protein